MRYRIAYDHAADGAGEVTRHQGQPLDEVTAHQLAAEMADEYTSVVVEWQERPGARWRADER